MSNRIHDAFDIVKADDRLKESTKQFLSERSKKSVRPKRSPAVTALLPAACAVIFIVMGGLGYSWIRRPVSYVSMDVNPSIELALNRFDRVVSVTAFNMEGQDIVKGLSLRWKHYADAIHTVIESEGMRTYLEDGEELVLTVAADESHKNELERGVRRCAGHIGHDCHNADADISTVSQAHECGLSLGKYNAYLELLEYDSTFSADDCKSMSMARIRELIREYRRKSGEESSTGDNGKEGAPAETAAGSGNGCGNGHGGEKCRNQRISPQEGRGHHHRE